MKNIIVWNGLDLAALGVFLIVTLGFILTVWLKIKYEDYKRRKRNRK